MGKKIEMPRRKITPHKVSYYYILVSMVMLLIYAVVSIVLSLPKWPLITPFIPPLVWVVYVLFKKNIKLLWLYISDMQTSLFVIKLRENSIWSESAIQKVSRWVYPKKGEIRGEYWDDIKKKQFYNEKLTEEELYHVMKFKNTPLRLPHDPQDGVQRLVLIDALIYAHQTIQPLDDIVLNKFALTDEHMISFDLQTEINKLKND